MDVLTQIKDPQILDIGCGTGRTAIKIAKKLENAGHLFGIDIYEKKAISGNSLYNVQNNAKIEGVENKTTFHFGSATEIPFENNRFDIINVSSVLHEVHTIDNKIKAMKEIHRVLKPGGYLYLSEWNRTSWKTIAMSGIFCFVFKNKKYWYDLIEKNKLKILSYEKFGGFGLFIARK